MIFLAPNYLLHPIVSVSRDEQEKHGILLMGRVNARHSAIVHIAAAQFELETGMQS